MAVNMTDSDKEDVASRVADRLLVLMQISERMKGVEMQSARIASDLDSEKRTRSNSNQMIDTRLREVEKANWKSAGALATAIFVIELAKHFIKW